MTAKRRKRKPKPKQDSKPTDQIIIHGDGEEPASPVGTQLEAGNLASPINLREDTENQAGPAVDCADKEGPGRDSARRTGADRRTHPRYAFTADAEVVADEPRAGLKSHVRDLSQQGCYVDTDSPFALGTATEIRISKGAELFEARARVVSNQPGKGMGRARKSRQAGPEENRQQWKQPFDSRRTFSRKSIRSGRQNPHLRTEESSPAALSPPNCQLEKESADPVRDLILKVGGERLHALDSVFVLNVKKV